MKKLLALLVMFVLITLPLGAMQAPRGFAGKLWASTLALYGSKGPVNHFLCTAEPIAKIDGGYRILSAGHCVQLTPAGLQFSVAEEIGGARTPVTLIKAVLSDKLDFAIFDLKTTKSYTVFELGNLNELNVGEETVNPNFALGLGKQLSLGIVSSMPLVSSEDCTDDCIGNFLVQEYAGPGASGSAILSAKTHKVLGILVYEFGQGQVGFAVEPISLLVTFNITANQPHPVDDEEK
jgi:Trypsin-like peptidase domain